MNTVPNSTQPQYELKHRLTGAAVLMVLAVVVIPLLLSEPALEANSNSSSSDVSVQTFQSRIVPLNIDNINGAAGDTVATVDQGYADDAVVVDTRKPALLDLTPKDSSNQTGGETGADSTNSETKTTLVMTENKQQQKSGKENASSAAGDAPKEALSIGVATTTKTGANTEKSSGDAAIGGFPEESTGEGGWVVRVGTFSKQANVDSVAALLSNSGFNPKTKPVDTSLGKSTRVWLGPYAKRETANKISDRLKALTGEKGYVTRTSS